MRRRSFLAAIVAAFVAPDPEKLLWQPGKKLILIPPAPKVGFAATVYAQFNLDLPLLSALWNSQLGWRVVQIDDVEDAVLPSPNGGSILIPIQSPAPAIQSRPR